jgi:hypothetical protein
MTCAVEKSSPKISNISAIKKIDQWTKIWPNWSHWLHRYIKGANRDMPKLKEKNIQPEYWQER